MGFKSFLALMFFFTTVVSASDFSELEHQWQSLSKKAGNNFLLTTLKEKEFDKSMINWILEQDADRIEDLADDGVERYPEVAQIWYLRGRIHAIQAMNSMLSALSHASDSLESFEKAAKLQPQQIDYQKALFSFYMGAPSIAGGDDEKALEIAQIVKSLDKRSGYRALLSLGYFKEHEKKDEWIAEIISELGEIPELEFYRGMKLSADEDFVGAIEAFRLASQSQLTDEDSKEYKLYAQYQLGRANVAAKQYSEEAEKFLRTYVAAKIIDNENGLPDSSWASFRLAELMILKGDKAEAKTIIESIDIGKDKRLQKEIKRLKKKKLK